MARMKVGGWVNKQVGESFGSHLCVCDQGWVPWVARLGGGGLVVGGCWVPASDGWRQAVIVQCGMDPQDQVCRGTNSHAQLMDDDAMYLALSGGGMDVVAQPRHRT
jgi:hypothetical protein